MPTRRRRLSRWKFNNVQNCPTAPKRSRALVLFIIGGYTCHDKAMGFVYTVGRGRHARERAEPFRASLRLPTSPQVGRLSRGQSPRKEAPHAVGSWPSLRGLRGFAALPKLSNKNTAAL